MTATLNQSGDIDHQSEKENKVHNTKKDMALNSKNSSNNQQSHHDRNEKNGKYSNWDYLIH